MPSTTKNKTFLFTGMSNSNQINTSDLLHMHVTEIDSLNYEKESKVMIPQAALTSHIEGKRRDKLKSQVQKPSHL